MNAPQNALNSGTVDAQGFVIPDSPRFRVFSYQPAKGLINPEKVPSGEKVPTAQDCYRFVLSNPHVDICMTGVRTMSKMNENLKVLDMNKMNDQEMAWMRRIGDYIYGRKSR